MKYFAYYNRMTNYQTPLTAIDVINASMKANIYIYRVNDDLANRLIKKYGKNKALNSQTLIEVSYDDAHTIQPDSKQHIAVISENYFD